MPELGKNEPERAAENLGPGHPWYHTTENYRRALGLPESPAIELNDTELAAARDLAAGVGQPILVVEVEAEPAEREPERELEL